MSVCLDESPVALTPVEVLQNIVAEFRTNTCAKSIAPEKLTNEDSEKYFAYYCEHCDTNHGAERSEWAKAVAQVKDNYPENSNPDYNAYATMAIQMVHKVKHFDIRDYVESYVKSTSEYLYVTKAINASQRTQVGFMEFLCKSEVTSENTHAETVIRYDCLKCNAAHYVTSNDFNLMKKEINESKKGVWLAARVSKQAKRLYLREVSQLNRLFFENNLFEKETSIAFLNTLEKKKKNREKEAIARAHNRKMNPSAKKKAKSPVIESAPAKPAVDSTIQNPIRLYILPPHLMTQELLIEYQKCGRKIAHNTLEEAKLAYVGHSLEGHSFYKCLYEDHYHYGRGDGKVTGSPASQAKSGLTWYKNNYKKANRFIHRIMLE